MPPLYVSDIGSYRNLHKGCSKGRLSDTVQLCLNKNMDMDALRSGS